jgi:hypothetical protein
MLPSPLSSESRVPRGLALPLGGLALGLLVSMLAAALHDFSQAWDVAYYHLPFAGRIVGLLPASDYVLSTANLARYQGFPLLAEGLQGLAWRITGRPESMNLVGFASVPLVAWFARRRLGVPWYTSVLSLLAIPLVHTHATSAYVDLPGNAAASVLVLLAIEAWGSERAVGRRSILLAVVAAFVAAHVKPMLHPIVIVSLAALGVRVARTCPPAEKRRFLALLLVALPFVFATPLENLVLHGNPYFPLRLTLFGHPLAGTEDAYSSSPDWLATSARPVRFVCSLLEMGARPFGDTRRWTIDQWMAPEQRGYRMGGFFNAYVVVELGMLVWRVMRDRSRAVFAGAVGFTALSLIVSLLPQSHELRYYMAWMIVLVLLNAWLASRPEAERGAPGPVAVAAVAVCALGVVLAVTRGAYAYPSGSSFAELVRAKVDERVIAGIGNGERVCVNREPFDVLWAPVFHTERRYVLKEAESAADCEGFRPLP